MANNMNKPPSLIIDRTYEIYETQDINGKSKIYPVYRPTSKFNDSLIFLNWIRMGAK